MHNPKQWYRAVFSTTTTTETTTETLLLSSIAISLEVEPQLEDVVLELTAEPALIRVLPFPVYNLEGNVLQHKCKKEWIRTALKKNHVLRQPLQNHPSGHLGVRGWATSWSAGNGQCQRMDIHTHARTAHSGLPQKTGRRFLLNGPSCPTQQTTWSRDWTELKWKHQHLYPLPSPIPSSGVAECCTGLWIQRLQFESSSTPLP